MIVSLAPPDYEMLLALDDDTPTRRLQQATPTELRRLPVYSYRYAQLSWIEPDGADG